MSGKCWGREREEPQSEAQASFLHCKFCLARLNLKLPMWKTLNPGLEETQVSFKYKPGLTSHRPLEVTAPWPYPSGLGLSCYEKLCSGFSRFGVPNSLCIKGPEQKA